jgi:octaprenyl-diphosphate synthase
MEQLYSLIGADMKAVDAVIRQRLHSEVACWSAGRRVHRSERWQAAASGAGAASAGASGLPRHHHHELAAVIEFIHTATFLHDDVVDASDLRRGRETGQRPCSAIRPVCWLATFLLYSRAFQMMVAVTVNDMRIMRVLSDATNVIAEGEVLQLMNCHDAGVDEAGYLQVIRYKTAKLFEAAAQLGAIIGGGGESRGADDGHLRHAPGNRVSAD